MHGLTAERMSKNPADAADRLRELAYMAEEFDITKITVVYEVQA